MIAPAKLSPAAFRAAIPSLLQATDAWIAHCEKKPLVLPDGRRAAKTNVPTSWRPFDYALKFLERTHNDPRCGVGFVFQRDQGVVFLDFDQCLDDGGAPKPWVAPLLEPFRGRTFIERSRSGRGLHVFVLGSVGRAHPKLVPEGLHLSGDEGHVEVYCDKRFVALTGDLFENTPALLAPMQGEIDALLATLGASPGTDRPPAEDRGLEPERAEEVRSMLAALDPDMIYEEWIRVGMAVHHGLGKIGFELWDEWSSKGTKYKKGETAERWQSFKRDGGTTLGTLVNMARKAGWLPTATPEQDFGTGSTRRDQFAVLEDLNEKFFVIEEAGRHFVASEWFDPARRRRTLKRFTFAEFKARYLGQTVQNHEGKHIQLAASWLAWRNRRQYLGGVVFAPTGSVPADDVYNLWSGWPIEPKPGDWTIIREHIRDVLCAGSDELNAYFVGWLRRLVQQPDQPGEVVPVFRGAQGAGKSVIGNAVKRVFGQHAMAVASPRAVTGQFNAHLRDLVLLVANEAVFAGDRATISALKALITDPTIFIEQKGIDAIEVPNFLHIIMTTNAEWAVPVAIDDRRFAVFDVSSSRVGDRAYFRELHAAVDDDTVIAAMLHDLLAEPLGDFQVRDIPATSARRDQMLHSLEGPEAWICDVLARGGLGLNTWSEWPEWAPTQQLIESHEAWARAGRFRHATHGVVLGKFLRRFFRSSRPRGENGEMGPRGYWLGTLEQARERFCAELGLSPDVFGGKDADEVDL
jgi:hypothetical protein